MNISSEPGGYFRDIYADLVERIPELPTSDPTPNLRQCIHTANFVRAEMLARQHNLPSDVIMHLREMAILQYLIDWGNITGLRKVIDQFNFSPAEVSRIIELIQKEKTYPWFSFSKNTELAVDENWVEIWQKDYYPLVQQLIGKPSVLARFMGWIKSPFVRS